MLAHICDLTTVNCSRHSKRCKETVFHFTYSLFIGPDLDSLVNLVLGGEVLLAVGESMRVEYSNIKLSPFKRTTSKAIGGNVQPGTIGSDCRGTSEGFNSDELQDRLYAYINANFRKPITNSVSNFIVSDVGKATFGAGERVFHTKICPTSTIGGDVGGLPTVPQSESIPERPLAE